MKVYLKLWRFWILSSALFSQIHIYICMASHEEVVPHHRYWTLCKVQFYLNEQSNILMLTDWHRHDLTSHHSCFWHIVSVWYLVMVLQKWWKEGRIAWNSATVPYRTWLSLQFAHCEDGGSWRQETEMEQSRTLVATDIINILDYVDCFFFRNFSEIANLVVDLNNTLLFGHHNVFNTFKIHE